MPLGLRNIEPVCLGAHRIHCDGEEDRTNTNLTVSNNAIVGALLQLASLVRHADDLFCDISDECQKVVDRTGKLTNKIVRLDETIAKLHAKQVAVPVGDLKQFSSVRDHHEARHGFDSHLFLSTNRPQCLQDQYHLCQTNPSNILRAIDLYRHDGLSGSKLFKFWPIILNEHKVKTPDLNLPRKVQRIRSFEKKYKTLKIRERPKTIHGWDDFTLEDSKNELAEEKKKEKEGLVSTEPPVVIPIDTSGSNFERMQSLRLSGRKGKEEREKRKKRRRTVSGVPDNIMHEIEQFERHQRDGEKPRKTPRSYSFDDLDAEDDLVKRDEGIVKYLDEIDGKMEERVGEEKALKLMKYFPCRRSRSLPRCVKLGSVSRALSAERRSQKDLNGSYASSLSMASLNSTSSRLSRSTKRSSIISNKLRLLVSSGSAKEKPRPKSLDLDTLLNEDDHYVDRDEQSKSAHNLAQHKSPSMPDGMLIRSQSGKSETSIGPGNYYNFESSTLPRTQAKKYDFPWESLPKDWTTSVRLREISKRRSREDRQSSSGNWSGTSSNRHSMDSDNVRTDGLKFNSQYSLGKDSGRDSLTLEEENDNVTDGTSTAGYAGDGTSTLAGSSDSVSVGNPKSDFSQLDTQTWLQSLAVRAAKRDDISPNNADALSCLSRLTRQNIMALDLIMSEQPVRKITEEESSIYSVDQEGFYTSFHNDSGLKKSTNTLVDEEEYSQTKDTNSVCSVDSVIHRPDGVEKFAALRKGNSNQSKMLSKVTPPTPPTRNSSKLGGNGVASDSGSSLDSKASPPGLLSFPSQDSSVSESDQETVFARVKDKTQISSSAFPSLVALSTSTSDDESSPDSRRNSGGRHGKKKGDDYIFNENECEVVSMTEESMSVTSPVLSYFSFQDGSFQESPRFGDIAASSPLEPPKSPLDCTDQGYDSLTLPKSSQNKQPSGGRQEGSYQSWPRSHKSSQPTSGILKTPEKAGDNCRPPKSLNFAPMVNMFNPGTPNSVQMPLPSPSNSSSSEGNLSSIATNTSSFEAAIASRTSYKLSMPISAEQARSRSRQQERAKKDLPLKYQPAITVTPRSRSGERQGSDRSSGAYVKLTPDGTRPVALYAAPVKPNASSTPQAAGATRENKSPNLYAISPVTAPEDQFRQSQEGKQNRNVNYMDMQGSLSKSLGSNSSLASSDCLNFTEDGNTYVSMSSQCSSPNLSNMDFSITNTPSGSMDSLLDSRRTPTNSKETDTYQINTHLQRNHSTNIAMDTVAIVTAGSSVQSDHSDSKGVDQTFSSFRSSDSSASSYRVPGRRSLDSSVSDSRDLTTVSQISQSQMSTPAPAPSQRQSRTARKEPSYRTPNGKSGRISYPIDQQHYAQNGGKLRTGDFRQGVHKGNLNSQSERKSLPSSKSCPSGLTNVLGPQNTSGKSNQSKTTTYQKSNSSPVPPTVTGVDLNGPSSRTDSYRAAVGGSTVRSGSYRVANMHQSKSFPVLPATKKSGPYQVAMAMNPGRISQGSEDPTSRADSYRMAVRMTNGVVPDTHNTNRNSSYRVAMKDVMSTEMNSRLDQLSQESPKGSVGGRDVRRMGITDVDQAKGITGKSPSTQNGKSSLQQNGQQYARIRKATKPDIDPIQVLSSMDYNKNDTRKSNKNNQNRSSTYLQFDPIFEDLEDFSNSTESLRMAMTASLKMPSKEATGSMGKGDNHASNYSAVNGDRRGSSGKAGSAMKTARKSKSSSNIEIEDDWRFSAV